MRDLVGAKKKLEIDLLNLRNNLQELNEGIDQLLLDTISGLDPIQSLWENRDTIDHELYGRCLGLINLYI